LLVDENEDKILILATPERDGRPRLGIAASRTGGGETGVKHSSRDDQRLVNMTKEVGGG